MSAKVQQAQDDFRLELERCWSITKRWAMRMEAHGTTKTIATMLSVYDNDIEKAYDVYNKAFQMVDICDKHIVDPDYSRLYTWARTLWDDLYWYLPESQQLLEEVSRETEKNNRNLKWQKKPTDPRVPTEPQWLSYNKVEGYIYLVMGLFEPPAYKIGFSKKPRKRIHKFDVVLPFPIDVLHLIKTDHMRAIEAYLHDKYNSKRVNGEWFELSDADVAELCAIETLNAEDIA